jgi:hypothetical protein
MINYLMPSKSPRSVSLTDLACRLLKGRRELRNDAFFSKSRLPRYTAPNINTLINWSETTDPSKQNSRRSGQDDLKQCVYKRDQNDLLEMTVI